MSFNISRSILIQQQYQSASRNICIFSDIDECDPANRQDNCDDEKQECVNTEGSFKCKCKKGYVITTKGCEGKYLGTNLGFHQNSQLNLDEIYISNFVYLANDF